MTGTETPLGGGNMSGGVVRVGDTVRRPAGPWTPAVHTLLAHLHEAGFHGAPRALGIDERGREVLTFIPGTTAWPDQFHLLDDDAQLRRAALLIRDFHDASPPSPRRQTHAGRRSPRPMATRSSPTMTWPLEPDHRQPAVGLHRLGHRRTRNPALGPRLRHARVRPAKR